jgi:hypothetical protein
MPKKGGEAMSKKKADDVVVVEEPGVYTGEKPRDHATTNKHRLGKVQRGGKEWSVCKDCAYEEPGTPREGLA